MMDTQTISDMERDVGTPADLPPSGAEAAADVGAHSDAPAEEALRAELTRRAEAEGLSALYPDFDLDRALDDPDLGALLRGETTPSLRHLYEATHLDQIVESRVQSRLDAAVAAALASAIPEAVTAAVAESEERLLGHIRARGQRPGENGVAASAGIRMHPAVERLTRRERAMLAARAERGETIRF